MVLPVVPIALGIAVLAVGAFAGAQVDDAIDQPPQAVPVTQSISPVKIAAYAAGAFGIYWVAKKGGLLR